MVETDDRHNESIETLLEIIEEIAEGNYSNDIMRLTAEDQPEAIRRIAEAVGLMMVRVEARQYQAEMLIEELKALHRKIEADSTKVVSALATALSARDKYTEGHTTRVSEIACKLAARLEVDDREMEFVRLGAILHDIGKIGFPDTLFQEHDHKNPKKLIKEITRHPSTGRKILNDLDFLGPALEYIYCHHERPDGRGYPCGKTDAEIPLGAKIISVADAFDAMTTDRSYQKAMSRETALGILKNHAGSKWDPACVETLESIFDRENEEFLDDSSGNE